eukprot:3025557-Prymnesium_polylepis.1
MKAAANASMLPPLGFGNRSRTMRPETSVAMQLSRNASDPLPPEPNRRHTRQRIVVSLHIPRARVSSSRRPPARHVV